MTDLITMQIPAYGIGRIVLNRPEKANVQTNELLFGLDAALTELSRDPDTRVIIVAAAGEDFCVGEDTTDRNPDLTNIETIGNWGGFQSPAMEGYLAFAEEIFGLGWRWRNIPKPVIAEVQGRVVGAGLMLAWICDIIVASNDSTFTDPSVAVGVNGTSYFAHAWEVGTRKAKEMLFTSQGLTAKAAERIGMVNRVVARADLAAETLELAQVIATQPTMGVRLAKMAVNQVQDQQGFYRSLRAAMGLNHVAHAEHWARHGGPNDPNEGEQIEAALGRSLLP